MTCYKCLKDIKLAHKIQQTIIANNNLLTRTINDVETMAINSEPDLVQLKTEPVETMPVRDTEVIDLCEDSDVVEVKTEPVVKEEPNLRYSVKVPENVHQVTKIMGIQAVDGNGQQYLIIPDNIIQPMQPPCIVKEIPVFDESTMKKSEKKLKHPVKCKECHQIFNSVNECREHYKDHLKRNCKTCRKNIPFKVFEEHRKSHNSGICDYCGLKTKDAKLLRSHIYYHHFKKTLKRTIKCEVCGIEVIGDLQYDTHKRKLHTGCFFITK